MALRHPIAVWILLSMACAYGTDVTFYAISDPHYGLAGSARDSARARIFTHVNNLPGTAYPSSIGGGFVDPPRAVLIPGDLIEILDTSLWRQYESDYGVNGDKKLAFPVIDGMGNHDFYTTGSIKDTLWMVKKMMERHARRRDDFLSVDAAGYNLSWQWDDVHFVSLTFSDQGADGRSLKAMDFLRDDLEKYVGSSGRPVFVMQHFPPEGDDQFFPTPLRVRLAEELRKYNVIGLLHGHTHNKAIYKWTVSGNSVDVFDDGSVMNGDVVAFHITDGRMRVAVRTAGGWVSDVFMDKRISMATRAVETGVRRTNQSRPSRFSVPAAGWSAAIPARVRRVEVLGLGGRTLRTISVRAGYAEWDGRDADGRRLPPGLYLLKDAGGGGSTLGKVLLL